MWNELDLQLKKYEGIIDELISATAVLKENLDDKVFGNYRADVVMYDEVEKFRNPPNDGKESSKTNKMLYDYPYMSRTTILSKNNFRMGDYTQKIENYEYQSNTISFKLS